MCHRGARPTRRTPRPCYLSIISFHGLFRPDAVTANDPAWIFGGMWRLRRMNSEADPLTTTTDKWKELQQKIIPYLEFIEVFFAPTTGLLNNERCHVEGCIAQSLRTKHPEDARFYPRDNRADVVGAMVGKLVPVTSDHPIMGLDPFIEL